MFITEDFLLTTETSKKLYHEYAKGLPIIDYHCHLEPELIERKKRYYSITELWLADDHYKWRAMRANGISEKYITGDGSDWEKFEAWSDTVESLVGHPLYHWTHLELKEYFGITDLLNKKSAKKIYQLCNNFLLKKQIDTHYLIKKSKVEFIGTTDDILSNLESHKKLKGKNGFLVAPTFRPDSVLDTDTFFSEYLLQCEELNDNSICTYSELLNFLLDRINYFNNLGCRSADHGFKDFIFSTATDEEIETIFTKGRSNSNLTEVERLKWQGRILIDLSKEYSKNNWILQIHFGAIRNTNIKLFESIGKDHGTDSIYDQANVATHLNQFLNHLDYEKKLPKTILYNLNPMINDVVASTAGNFQGNDEGIKSKVQFGAAWWFNDTYEGIIKQLESLSTQGSLMNFIGMLTDSRSFVSYPRHDYFRRILCQFIGEKVEQGFYPDDVELLKKLVNNICYRNSAIYFNLPISE